jgi:hypothetical protein
VIKEESVEVVSEAKSPYQRHIAASGGVDLRPAPPGRVLDAREIDTLRELAKEVTAIYTPVLNDAGQPRPWDIEFGFIDGELTLFQIRPLVERGSGLADNLLRDKRPDTATTVPGDTVVQMNESTGTE